MKLTVGSLFSGAAGFEQGFEEAGFRTAWQCEIDRDATDVLERHYPNVRRFKDVREIDPSTLEPVDVVVFGSPCQDMSVAGNRAGLDGERSGLFHEAVRIISGLRPTPAFCIWENVPGALSSAGGRDFGSILDALADIGALDISWRVLDAQWFGVPQRRRRIFLVADFGGERAASVLFESESVRGHSQAGSEARQGSARDAENGAGSGSAVGYHENLRDVYPYSIAPCLPTTGLNPTRPGGFFVPATAYTLAASSRGTGDGHGNAWNSTYVPQIAPTLMGGSDNPASHGKQNGSDRGAFIVSGEAVAVAIDGQSGGGKNDLPLVAHCLTARNQRISAESETFVTGIDWQQAGGTVEDGSPTLTTTRTPAVCGRPGMSVRRLTPVECERLMDWPDDWTRYRADGTELSDGARYRLCGNGVVAPVAFWLAQRVRATLEAT